MRSLYTPQKNFNLIFVLLCLTVFIQTFIFSYVNASTPKRNPVIVSLGDSFSSGEGIPPFYGQEALNKDKVKNHDWLAHRSQNSWPGKLTLPDVKGQMRHNRNTNWFFAATSGAKIEHLTNSFRKKYEVYEITGYEDIPPQLDIFKELGDKKADYITLTIGGNDASFVKAVIDAAYSTIKPESLQARLDKIWAEFFRDGGIRDCLKQAYTGISDTAGAQATIIVAGYPRLIFEDADNVLFKKENIMLLNNSVSEFNREIEKIVNSLKNNGMNIHFVSVEDEFKGHEAYSPDPYINPIMIMEMEDITHSFISAYSIHPNEKGAEAYARCVQRKIDELEQST